jgi:hypothetical protein
MVSVEDLDLGLETDVNHESIKQSEEVNNKQCLEPHIHGERMVYSVCMVCGRFAKDHELFKIIDNPAASKEKEIRLQHSITKQSTLSFYSATLNRITLLSNPKQIRGHGHFTGGYVILFSGWGFQDNGQTNRWARFGDNYADLQYINKYRLTCICPPRQSVHSKVDIEITLDGGRTSLCMKDGWKYTGQYTPKSKANQEACGGVYVWGNKYHSTKEGNTAIIGNPTSEEEYGNISKAATNSTGKKEERGSISNYNPSSINSKNVLSNTFHSQRKYLDLEERVMSIKQIELGGYDSRCTVNMFSVFFFFYLL